MLAALTLKCMYNRPEFQKGMALSENHFQLLDAKILTNMMTYLILMRIDRAQGSQSYLEKSHSLVLKALEYDKI